MAARRDTFRAAEKYQPLLTEFGLDARTVFTHPDVKVWRTLPERENCTLDAVRENGRTVRLHIKRYKATIGATPADLEARGIMALDIEKIPTVPLVGWGSLRDGRSFLITEDLYGYRDAEKLLRDGFAFEELREPTADLAALLHNRGLHHRDLYLCHFFVNERDSTQVRLIDAGRVQRLPGWPTRNRWIVKDLAEFWFSTLNLRVSDLERQRWLERYASQRNLKSTAALQRAIERKAASIAKHDARLRETQKDRNVSIPT